MKQMHREMAAGLVGGGTFKLRVFVIIGGWRDRAGCSVPGYSVSGL